MATAKGDQFSDANPTPRENENFNTNYKIPSKFAIVNGQVYSVFETTGKPLTTEYNPQSMSMELVVADDLDIITITNEKLYTYDDMYKKMNFEQKFKMFDIVVKLSVFSEWFDKVINGEEISPKKIKYVYEIYEQLKNINFDNVSNIVQDILDDITITFDENGGSGYMAEIYKDEGQKYVLPPCEFIAPEGKQFSHWSIKNFDYNVGDEITISDDLISIEGGVITVCIMANWEDIPQDENND